MTNAKIRGRLNDETRRVYLEKELELAALVESGVKWAEIPLHIVQRRLADDRASW